MPIEIKGEHLRVRVKNPNQFSEFRTQDVGAPGHSQRISGYNKRKKKWETQAWIFPISDVKKRRANTMKLLRKLKVTNTKLKQLGL